MAMIAGMPGGMEWIILLLVALLIFGGTRLASIGKGAGRAVREFKEETSDLRKKDETVLPPAPNGTVQTPAAPAAPVVVEDVDASVEQRRI